MDEAEIATRVERYDEAFAVADSAAARGDGAGVVAALLQPHIAAGLAYRVKKHLDGKKMYTVSQDDVELVVAEALKEVYDRVSTEDPPKGVGAYLFITARNKAYAIYSIRRGMSVADAGAMEGIYGRTDGIALEDSLAALEAKQRTYLRIIREKIIPQLGKENVRRVMDYIFEAVEKGLSAEHSDIASALGVSEDHVRSWKSRGFARLKVRLEAEGLLDPARRDELLELAGDVQDFDGDDEQDSQPA
jgi:DNA-directed RNA polymerase specialized sigma24 family protein